MEDNRDNRYLNAMKAVLVSSKDTSSHFINFFSSKVNFEDKTFIEKLSKGLEEKLKELEEKFSKKYADNHKQLLNSSDMADSFIKEQTAKIGDRLQNKFKDQLKLLQKDNIKEIIKYPKHLDNLPINGTNLEKAREKLKEVANRFFEEPLQRENYDAFISELNKTLETTKGKLDDDLQRACEIATKKEKDKDRTCANKLKLDLEAYKTKLQEEANERQRVNGHREPEEDLEKELETYEEELRKACDIQQGEIKKEYEALRQKWKKRVEAHKKKLDNEIKEFIENFSSIKNYIEEETFCNFAKTLQVLSVAKKDSVKKITARQTNCYFLQEVLPDVKKEAYIGFFKMRANCLNYHIQELICKQRHVLSSDTSKYLAKTIAFLTCTILTQDELKVFCEAAKIPSIYVERSEEFEGDTTSAIQKKLILEIAESLLCSTNLLNETGEIVFFRNAAYEVLKNDEWAEQLRKRIKKTDSSKWNEILSSMIQAIILKVNDKKLRLSSFDWKCEEGSGEVEDFKRILLEAIYSLDQQVYNAVNNNLHAFYWFTQGSLDMEDILEFVHVENGKCIVKLGVQILYKKIEQQIAKEYKKTNQEITLRDYLNEELNSVKEIGYFKRIVITGYQARNLPLEEIEKRYNEIIEKGRDKKKYHYEINYNEGILFFATAILYSNEKERKEILTAICEKIKKPASFEASARETIQTLILALTAVLCEYADQLTTVERNMCFETIYKRNFYHGQAIVWKVLKNEPYFKNAVVKGFKEGMENGSPFFYYPLAHLKKQDLEDAIKNEFFQRVALFEARTWEGDEDRISEINKDVEEELVEILDFVKNMQWNEKIDVMTLMSVKFFFTAIANLARRSSENLEALWDVLMKKLSKTELIRILINSDYWSRKKNAGYTAAMKSNDVAASAKDFWIPSSTYRILAVYFERLKPSQEEAYFQLDKDKEKDKDEEAGDYMGWLQGESPRFKFLLARLLVLTSIKKDVLDVLKMEGCKEEYKEDLFLLYDNLPFSYDEFLKVL